MDSSESETESSLPSSSGYNEAAREIDEVRANLQSSDSGVSTASETSSCEDCPASENTTGISLVQRPAVGFLRVLLPWSRRSARDSLTEKVGGTTALIQHTRPSELPAKSAEEDRRHRRQYVAILEEARRREIRETQARRVRREESLRREERLASDSNVWCGEILPKFETVRSSKRVRDLWWDGLPPCVRGKVWKLAIANDLGINRDLYDSYSRTIVLQEPSDESAIKLDVSRTFSNLGVFQEGGPLHESLRNLLMAYARYNSDVGYVQGMSFIGAVLVLNTEPRDAFVCFANLLNKPCHRAAFALDQRRMNSYYRAFSGALAHRVPKVHTHFGANGLSPDMYLLDWLYTVYAKAVPLDVVCRIWDVFVRDGEEFLFRTALGILRMYQDRLLGMDFVHCSQFLNKLPENIEADALFDNIARMSTDVGARSFQEIIFRLN